MFSIRSQSVVVLASLALAACTRAAASDGAFRDLSFDAARDAAKKERKVVMVDFFTTWCGPCKKLDAVTWRDEKVRAWIGEKAVALKLDAEEETEIAARFHVNAYPTVLFVQPDGTEIDRLVGYRDPAAFLEEAALALAGKDAVARAKDALAGHENDPMFRERYADALVEKGHNEEALSEYLWCFDHGLEHSRSYVGVRLSFLLGRIVRLGETYPPARKALEDRRDALEASILGGHSDASAPTEFARLNEEMRQNERTLKLYDELGAKGPEGIRTRQAMTGSIVDALMEHRRYADVLANAVDIPKSLEKKIAAYRKAKENPRPSGENAGMQPPDMSEFIKRQVLEIGRRYYEAYLGVGRTSEADRIAELVLEFEPSGKLCADLMQGALRASVPAAAESLGRFWSERLPESERAAVREALKDCSAVR